MANKPVPVHKPGRAELEARLAKASRRIASRFERLEAHIPSGPTATAKKLLSNKRVRLGLLVGAGALVGLLVVRRSRRSCSPYEDGLDAVSDRLAQSVVDRLRDGASPEEAVSGAVRDAPPVLHLREAPGILSEFVSVLSKTVSSVVAREVGKHLLTLLSKVREDSDEV